MEKNLPLLYSKYKQGADEKGIREAVNRLGITLPDGMQFEETEAGIYKFTINMVEIDNMLMDGMIKYQYYGQKGIGRLDNQILNASFYKKFDAISEQEAYKKIIDGEY